MQIARPLPLLGGLTPTQFMARHWQTKPLLVRAALADALGTFDHRQLFALAARDDVESRLVTQTRGQWSVRSGPLGRRSLPALRTPGWSLLVQGVDLHDEAARRLLERFRFIADARLDDVMLSFASDGGGVGPHVDSYDVFLLQVAGRRRWRVGRVPRPRLRDDVPLKMLAAFAPRHDWLLEPGDMLYLPPGWGHDGVAVGPCLTASIGFRAPAASEMAAAVLQRVADAASASTASRSAHRYGGSAEAATLRPARIPAGLQRFAATAVQHLLADRSSLRVALGETMSEPKASTWFERGDDAGIGRGIVLDRRTRMLYDHDTLYVNGESFAIGAGGSAQLLRRLADRRRLDRAEIVRLGGAARERVAQWAINGWCHGIDDALKEDDR